MSKSYPSNGMMRAAWNASRGGIVAVVVFGAFINLLKFAMPLYTLQVLDRIPHSHSTDTLLMLTLIALLAVLTGVCLEAIRRRLLVQWSGWVHRQFGPRLVEAGISGDAGGGKISAPRLLDHLQSIRGFIEKAVAPMLDLVWVPAFVAVVWWMHDLFGAIMLTAIGLRIVSGYTQNHLTRPPRQAWSAASRDARKLVEAADRHNLAIGSGPVASSLAQSWLGLIRTKLSERETSQTHSGLFSAINTALYRCLYIAGMGFGVWLVVNDSMTIGGIIAVNIIMRFGFRVMDRGVRRWDSLIKARKAYRRLHRVVSRMPVRSLAQSGIRTVDGPLVVSNVFYRLQGQRQSLLRKISFSVASGQMLCVIGRTASGKSVLARLLAGSMRPRKGRIRLGETDLAAMDAHQRAGLVGLLADESRLFAGTIAENITALQDERIGEIVAAALLVGIHDRIMQLDAGYDTLIDDQTTLFSAGERRRLLLARAFYRRPPLIVLDEPAAHLDRPGRDLLITALNELKLHGCRIVVLSQSNRLGRIADQTFMLIRRRERSSTRGGANTTRTMVLGTK